MQILLIDSNCERSRYWLERLQEQKAKVVAVATPAEALVALEQSQYSLIVCGGSKSEGSWGEQMRKLVPQLRRHCHTIFCLTNEEDCETQQAAYLAGFHDCITERSSEAELSAKFQHACQLESLHIRLAQAQKLESIGELAAGIAHEINTPIQYVGDNTRFVQSACQDITSILEICQRLVGSAGIEGNLTDAAAILQATMDQADVEYLIDEIPSAIQQSLEGVDRVANIVRAMKEFAHPGNCEMTPTDLGKAIENTVMVARNEWKYVADLDTVFDPNLPLVPCLPGELNQVLLNMIVNASHAIAESLDESPDQKGRIRITTQLAPPYAEIRVMDSGSGIPTANLEKIFTPFFTTKAAGKGTGQGLAIAHSVVVEKHNGTIHVESEPGEGTVFTIRLPLEVSKHPHKTRTEEFEFATTFATGSEL
jgi:signal transduction histidine kinase